MPFTQIERDDREAQAAIFRGLDAYNDAASGRSEPGRELALPVFGPGGRLAGGLYGYTYYDWLHVQVLGIAAGSRGRGLGGRVVRVAEAEAAGRGCRAAWAEADPDTGGFLTHLGWQEFGRLDDGPPATHKLFLRRDLHPAAQAGNAAVLDAAAVKASLALPPRTPLGLLLGDSDGAIEGGLWGWSEQGRLFVQLLFVPAHRRGQGLGGALIARATEIAHQRGCRVVWLDTFSFQARPFYERLGFTLFGTLADYPPGGARYFLVKGLDS